MVFCLARSVTVTLIISHDAYAKLLDASNVSLPVRYFSGIYAMLSSVNELSYDGRRSYGIAV